MSRHVSSSQHYAENKEPDRERIAKQIEAFKARGGSVRTYKPGETEYQPGELRKLTPAQRRAHFNLPQ